MDINIVWNAAKPGIITRLALALQKETGWTLSHRPRDSADLNYFMLYIMVGQTPYDKTKTAAWFSHYELTRPQKQDWWNTAASRVDLRLTSARQYVPMLESEGRTALVNHPPIDKQFIRKPFIGLSGYVHPGERKGEKLLKWLFDSGKFDDCHFTATGKGWPIVDTHEYNWANMHEFYQAIDVFLCTSSVEGIPMPPLEALAMGKPIVIPRGVGLLDDLPDIHNAIYRYELEDNQSLIYALESALTPIQARKHVSYIYIAKQWAKQHVTAFSEFLGASRDVIWDATNVTVPIETVSEIANEVDAMFPSTLLGIPITEVDKLDIEKPILELGTYNYIDNLEATLPDTAPIIKDGVILDFEYANEENTQAELKIIPIPDPIEGACAVFIAYGEPARECVQVAINSWHTYMREPCILISDAPLVMRNEDVFIEHPDTDIGARSIKTRLYEIAPDRFKYILYLDADTEIIGNVQFLFQCLVDDWDIVACMNPAQYTTLESGLRPDNKADLDLTYEVTNGLGNYLQPNGGVFGFTRNDATQKFFKQWHQEWQVFGARDQMAMFRALWKCNVNLYLLGQEWNTITRYNDKSMSAGILHHPMRARRWRGMIKGRLDGSEAWARVYPEGFDNEGN